MDRLTKPAHFLPVKSTYYVVELHVKHIVCLHGVPVSIASDRGSVFTSQFGKLQEAMGTRLDFSTTFHPQINGQSERTIQILKIC